MVYFQDFKPVEQAENKNNRCLHGLSKEICGYCQGTSKDQKKRKLKYKLI
jgi:hypothetical protein